jgi:hypothetical protein
MSRRPPRGPARHGPQNRAGDASRIFRPDEEAWPVAAGLYGPTAITRAQRQDHYYPFEHPPVCRCFGVHLLEMARSCVSPSSLTATTVRSSLGGNTSWNFREMIRDMMVECVERRFVSRAPQKAQWLTDNGSIFCLQNHRGRAGAHTSNPASPHSSVRRATAWQRPSSKRSNAITPGEPNRRDVAPVMPSLIIGLCAPYGPWWTRLQTRSG